MQRRFFVASPLSSLKTCLLSATVSHHLVSVLRAKSGQSIVLFDGTGVEYAAEIIEITKKQVRVTVGQAVQVERESPLKITLFQGLSRQERMDYVIQKAVELGVFRIVPIITERAQVRLTDDRRLRKMQHWQRIIESACEQSGRTVLPVIEQPVLWQDVIHLETESLKLVCSPWHRGLHWSQLERPAAVHLMIGPEGGLSEEEVATAVANGYRPMSMGPRILRTETAAVAALSLLQGHWGDLA